MVPLKSFNPCQVPDIIESSTQNLLGHGWHKLQTLNKRNEHKLAGEAWPTETERMIESFVCLCSLLCSCLWLQRAVMFPAKRHSVKLINKATWNISSAPKIATAKCTHGSYRLSKRGYKLPSAQPMNFKRLSFLLSFYLHVSHSFLFLRPLWCVISFVCLSPYYLVVWITIITAR